MKTDTQHLDYLISQYVDGSLDASGKKHIEQRLVNDPEARKLYKDHRDVQDTLDDWGNRIPLINWDDFDAKLAARLEHETPGQERSLFIRRWARPFSIAAGLALAAFVGYNLHALSNHPAGNGNIETAAGAQQSQQTIFVESGQPKGSLVHVVIEPGTPAAANGQGTVAISPPATPNGQHRPFEGTALNHTGSAAAHPGISMEPEKQKESPPPLP